MENVRLWDKLPKWLRFILILISIVTVIYWVGFTIYKLLDAIRAIGAFIFNKRNYWTFLCCILILVIGSLLVAQYYFNLDPFGKIAEWFISVWQQIKETIASYITG